MNLLTIYKGSKWIIVMLVVGIYIFSCNKVDYRSASIAVAKGLNGALTTSDSVYNYVLIAGSQTADFADSNVMVTGGAAFSDSPSRALGPVSSISINGQTLAANPNDYTYFVDFSDTSSESSLLKKAAVLNAAASLTGTFYRVHIVGSSAADSVTQNVYLPMNLLRYTSDFPSASLNIGNDMVLRWVPDPGNTIGDVGIQLTYDSVLSRFNDSALVRSIAPLTYTVPDNGSFTISASALQVFPTNGYVTISMARATQYVDVLPVSKKSVWFYGTATLQTPPLVVQGCGAGCPGPSHKCIADTCTAGHLTILSKISSPSQCVTTWGYVFPDGTAQVDSTVVTAGPCN